MPSSPKVAIGIRGIQNFTPATYVAGQLAGQKRLRQRNAVSCDPCRLRKVKCDHGQPCGACTLRMRQSECTYGGDLTDTFILEKILARKLELNEPDVDAINGLLAITRHMAYSMGLHRDVSIKTDVSGLELRHKVSVRPDDSMPSGLI
ncbi:hypothetical protein V1508DRAFT_424951 [Lipomyces doorenjongii]|uniref:uncharacterized protein n=1 Tax=Lipomyces doorenjongii TaxID=383834 RepID=UPI0034CEE086